MRNDLPIDPEAFVVVVSASTVPAHSDDRVPRFVLEQALAFAAQGATVHLLAPHTPSSRRVRWPKLEVPRVTQWRFRYAPRRLETLTQAGIMPALRERPWLALVIPGLIIAQFFALWRLVRRVRPNVIYAHWFTPQALTACAVSWLTQTPFGFTTHAADVAVWQRFGWFGRSIVRAVAERAAFITAVSTQTAAKLRAFFEEPHRARLDERLRILPMGVECRVEHSTSGDPRHAVVIARLVEKKGIHVLLEAWSAVLSAVPGARLTIAGTGPEEQRLRMMIRERGLTVDMPGYVMGQAKAELLASAGVIVQPSVIASDGDADGLPVALLEGIAAGCLPVASDASGAQDIIETGHNGYVVPSGDAPALARALIAAMTLPVSARHSMLGQGRQLATRVAWPHLAREYLSIIGEGTPRIHERIAFRPVLRSLKRAFFAAILIALGWFFWTLDWASLSEVRVAPGFLLAALVLTWGCRYYGVFIWRIVLVQLGAPRLPAFHVLADIYAKAWLARYIPGTVPWIAGKIYLAAEQGISKSRLAVSSIVEAAAQVVGAGLASLSLLALDGRVGQSVPFFRALALAGILFLTLLMIPPVFNRAVATGARLLRRTVSVSMSWKGMSTPIALYALGSLASGLALVVFSHALIPTLAVGDTLFLVGAFGLAGVIGMLTPLVPSGLGTRDGAQLLLLLVILPPPEAGLLVIATRLWSALVDIVFWAGATTMRRVLSA